MGKASSFFQEQNLCKGTRVSENKYFLLEWSLFEKGSKTTSSRLECSLFVVYPNFLSNFNTVLLINSCLTTGN